MLRFSLTSATVSKVRSDPIPKLKQQELTSDNTIYLGFFLSSTRGRKAIKEGSWIPLYKRVTKMFKYRTVILILHQRRHRYCLIFKIDFVWCLRSSWDNVQVTSTFSKRLRVCRYCCLLNFKRRMFVIFCFLLQV